MRAARGTASPFRAAPPLVPVSAPAVATTVLPRARLCGLRQRSLLVGGAALGVLVACVAAVGLGLPYGDEDDLANWLTSLAGGLRLRFPVGVGTWAWFGIGLLVLLATLHFLLAAVVLRAATGREVVPVGLGFVSQLAAAAANRITPMGVGAAGVNLRFLFRRGLPLAGAAGIVALVGLLGGIADVLLGLVLWAVGGVVGVPGAGRELARLAAGAERVALQVRHGSPWALALAAAAGLGLAVLLHRRARRPRTSEGPGAVRLALGRAADLGRRPQDLAVLLAASAGTTGVLAVALLVSVHSVGAGSTAGAGAVLMAYLVGAAAGSVVPVPGGVASTEAALASALVAAGVPLGRAVAAVLLYRTVTFWAPIPVGLLAARALRRRRHL